jgi:hypothetical protein
MEELCFATIREAMSYIRLSLMATYTSSLSLLKAVMMARSTAIRMRLIAAATRH